MHRLAPWIALACALVACAPPPTTNVRAKKTGPCADCHADESEGWEASMHHASFSSADFRASYAEEPLPFCLDCHAPRTKSLGAKVGGARGIDCQSCHPGADRHASEARGSSAARTPTRVETKPCATCHELTSEGSGTFLQSTASEHEASASRDVPCAGCHMKRVSPRARDHRFSVSRDAAFLSTAIVMSPPTVSATGVSFSLAARGVGHKQPTGDIFRELHVRAWVESPEGKIVGELEAWLHRDWDAHRRAFGHERGPDALADTRLDATPRAFTIDVAAPGSVLRVTVDYRRGFEARGGVLSTFGTLRILDEARPLDGR